MEVSELRPGLWRWTAPHPEWMPGKDRPGGWGQMVGCLYYEPSAEGADGHDTILIDPLAPPDGSPQADRFWKSLDADLERRQGRVSLLLSSHYHERHARVLLDRYGKRHRPGVWAHEAARERVSCEIAHPFRQETPLPGGVIAYPVAGLDASETAYWLPEHRALVLGDALIGAGGGSVRVAPPFWAPDTPEGARRYEEEYRPSLRRFLDLPLEMLIVSHGPPVLEQAASALESALTSPVWGK